MRILFISRKFPPSTGGMELLAYELYTALSARLKTRLVKWGGSNALLPVVMPWLALRAFGALLLGHVDIIHTQDGLLSPLGFVLARLFRKPWVVIIHGLDITYPRRFYQAVVPTLVRRADAVICISQAAADACLQRGVERAKITIIPLAVVDQWQPAAERSILLKQLGLPNDAQLLLTVGRLVERKGVAWFVDTVLPQLIETHPQLIYLVVGEGDERPAIEAAVARHQLADHVRLLGRISDDRRSAVYQAANIFVMPNIEVPGDIEGFGLVLLEATTFSLPTVAAGIQGVRDAVTDGRNGVLVETQDAAAFQKQITQWLDDPAAAQAFGAQARQYTLATFRWEKLVERYIELYQKVLGKHK